MKEKFDDKVKRYFKVTEAAFELVKKAPVNDKEKTDMVIEMVSNYLSDAKHFYDKGDKELAFAALNYAHGWLDCGAMMKFYIVTDNKLFTVD